MKTSLVLHNSEFTLHNEEMNGNEEGLKQEAYELYVCEEDDLFCLSIEEDIPLNDNIVAKKLGIDYKDYLQLLIRCMGLPVYYPNDFDTVESSGLTNTWFLDYEHALVAIESLTFFQNVKNQKINSH